MHSVGESGAAGGESLDVCINRRDDQQYRLILNCVISQKIEHFASCRC